MSIEIIKRIVDWAEVKEPWCQDAIRRIYQQGHLENNDTDELTWLCFATRSIHVPEEVNVPLPVGLTIADIGTTEVAQQAVSLEKITDVRNVNNLIEEQVLTFRKDGLSIIYGDNGSGKSGYSRILKQVCRARSKEKKILSNVFVAPPVDPPTAKVNYKLGDEEREIQWEQGKECPAELSNISLFDAECASVHVTEENALAFTPQGLDILPKLADLFRTIQAIIRSKIAGLEGNKPGCLKDVEKYPHTQVHSLIKNLNPASVIEDLRKWAERGADEISRLTVLSDILSQSPTQQSKLLGLRNERLVQLRDSCTWTLATTTNEVVAEIKELWGKYLSTRKAAGLAASRLFTDEKLPGVGGGTWKALWEAARGYSTQAAYPEKDFPFLDDSALCVLCQQTLSTSARKRLRGFEDYVKGETQRAADKAEAALQGALEPLNDMSGPRNVINELKELTLEDAALSETIRKILIVNRWRRRRILRNTASTEWHEVPNLPDFPVVELQRIIDNVGLRRQGAIKAANSEERKKLEKELLDIRARAWLEDIMIDIENEIERLKELEKLNLCLRDIDTTGLTRKNTELTDEFVTDELKAAFNRELKALGLTYLSVELVKVGGQYGVNRYQIQLAGRKQEVPVANIVSEGEHRAIALAAFLAELSTEPTKSGLIFDDPVSSLDHTWRQRMADRLIEEAKHRQVIILTHDLVFLQALYFEAEKNGIAKNVSHLIRDSRGVGISLDGVPWVAMPVTKKVGYLKYQLQKAETVWRNNGEDAYEPIGRHIYGLLRETWERAVEEILLGQVVVRFGREVQTNRLRYATDITVDDVKIINDGMTRCSRFMQGHDQAVAVNEKVPSPDELFNDIAILELWAKSMRPRRS